MAQSSNFNQYLIKLTMNKKQIVLPGDDLTSVINQDNNTRVVLGPGLKREPEKIIATKCGILCQRKPNIFWIDFHQKRFIVYIILPPRE